jgi:hypothetical protein
MRNCASRHFIPKHEETVQKCQRKYSFRYGLVVRIPGSHPGGPGSIPGNGNLNFVAWSPDDKNYDEDGIRTHAGRAHWISSPTP